MKNFNTIGAFPMVTMAQTKAPRTGATRTLTWTTLIHSLYASPQLQPRISITIRDNKVFINIIMWYLHFVYPLISGP